VISAGTERACAEFAQKNLLRKAQARPELAREVLDKIRRDGLIAAASAVRNRLSEPIPLGYSCAGTIIETGVGIDDLRPGDRVACAGAGFAVHAEFACVPRMLVARIASREVDFESAAFTTLGAVALHGVRTAEAKLGETVAVIGLGLLGQITVQILRAAGCAVIGLDLLAERADLATNLGATDATSSADEFRDLCLKHSNGFGVDSVLITAETPSSTPVKLAAEIARDRGIVVAVGAIGMELDRRHYYEKELDFRVSRSYGPGRYDAAYEQKGRDYPIGYVRWTETRNMEAFLQLIAEGKLNLGALIKHRIPINEALRGYDLIARNSAEPYLGIVIEYPENARYENSTPSPRTRNSSKSTVRVGVLGAGNFARGVLLPAMKRDRNTELVGICAGNGARAASAARRFRIAYSTSDEEHLLSDASINTVVIATRHHLHARQIIRALESGKHVFCEKPLCLTEEELSTIADVYSCAESLQLMVGFNRRFAPMAMRLKTILAIAGGPFTMHYRVNAGPITPGHWINDPEQGGGRILGEMCHFVDLPSFFCGSPLVAVSGRGISGSGGEDVIVSMKFADGSQGNIVYACNGDRAFSKERVEIFGSGISAVLDDFRRLEIVRHGKSHVFRSWLRPDKGHQHAWRAFTNSIRTGSPSPISFYEIAASTLATIRIAESLRTGREFSINLNHSAGTPVSLVS
jgi:predicted dehydrogenase/threonine dehydrogenase-like Zn-dependent dehydrogenase